MRFRRTNGDDMEFVLHTERDPDNRKFIMLWTMEQHLEAIGCKDKLHMIIETRDGITVGYMILAGLENEHQCMELLRITIADKGKGYGKESIRLAQQLVFEKLHAHRLWLDVMEHNYRAKLVYEQAGFVVEGKLRECIKRDDGYESLIIMGMLAQDYVTVKYD